jgi:uncharacterized protein YqeY
MTIKERLTVDVKAAMLAKDTARLETLRGLKSVILYAEVAAGKRDQGMEDNEIQALFVKEAKKRQESADLYKQGGSPERADKELAEKRIIEQYLPEQLSENALATIIENAINRVGATGPQDMGKVIGVVKQQVGSAGDGAVIAKLVKEKLS